MTPLVGEVSEVDRHFRRVVRSAKRIDPTVALPTCHALLTSVG